MAPTKRRAYKGKNLLAEERIKLLIFSAGTKSRAGVASWRAKSREQSNFTRHPGRKTNSLAEEGRGFIAQFKIANERVIRSCNWLLFRAALAGQTSAGCMQSHTWSGCHALN